MAESEPTPPGEHIERREMGITHADFFRIFPRVVAPGEVRRDGLDVTVAWPAAPRSLLITLSEEKNRTIAALRIPYVELEFRFQGFSGSERLAFLARFHRAFHKGGG